MGFIWVALGHLDELQKAEKYPISIDSNLKCHMQLILILLKLYQNDIVI